MDLLKKMTVVSSLPQQQQQQLEQQEQQSYASSTGANRRTDDLRRRNVAETGSGAGVNGGRDAVNGYRNWEAEDKPKEKVIGLPDHS